MFNPFELLNTLIRKPLKRQVQLYIAWKAVRHPLVAKTHENLLYEFFRFAKVDCATYITNDCVEAFANAQNSIYFQKQARTALRQFCRYWYKLGLLNEELGQVLKKDTIKDMEDVHPLLHVDKVERVKKLREEGLSFREIAAKMGVEDGRKYDVHSIHRWANYVLPSLSTAPSI